MRIVANVSPHEKVFKEYFKRYRLTLLWRNSKLVEDRSFGRGWFGLDLLVGHYFRFVEHGA